MKYLLLSIHAEYTELIFSGKKLAEIRKTAPAESIIEKNDFIRVILYETKAGGGCGAVVGWFDLYHVMKFSSKRADIAKLACLTIKQLEAYRAGGTLAAWEITNRVRLKETLPLNIFGLQRAPQSWQWLKAPISIKIDIKKE